MAGLNSGWTGTSQEAKMEGERLWPAVGLTIRPSARL